MGNEFSEKAMTSHIPMDPWKELNCRWFVVQMQLAFFHKISLPKRTFFSRTKHVHIINSISYSVFDVDNVESQRCHKQLDYGES